MSSELMACREALERERGDARNLADAYHAIRARLAAVTAERDAACIALARLVHEGDVHENEDCPGDDTCACAIAAAVNAALPICPTDNCGAMWPCEKHAPETHARWMVVREEANAR